MLDVPQYSTFAKIEPLNKGWSPDKKYYIETIDGERLLLRIADIDEYNCNRKKAEYAALLKAAELDINMSRPIDFGFCNAGKSIYTLLTWCDGIDVDESLPLLSETEQYNIGIKSGKLLNKLHTIPAPDDIEPWNERFWIKVDGRIDYYNTHPIRSDYGDLIVNFLTDNRHLLDNRPQTFNHGDFNKTNIIVTPDGEVGVIDFNAYHSSYGDPWWEFDPTNWGNTPNPHYCTGLINGYFNDKPSAEFFEMHRYYLAYDGLAALCETDSGQQGEVREGVKHLENVCKWFDNMKNLMPSWYINEVVL
jgi:Predicted aminoglycoside phosphotransferase